MRTSFISLSAAILFCCVAVAHAEDATTGKAVEGIVWGKVVHGLQLGISPAAKLGKTHEIAGFEPPVDDNGTIHVTIHLRNVSSKTVRLLPSVWDCLAMGDGGAILASKLTLTPADGGQPLTATYQGVNHLRILDRRRPDAESSQQTLRKDGPEATDLQLVLEEAQEYQIELEAGDSQWPEWIKLSLTPQTQTPWQLAKPPSSAPVGKYRVTAALIVDHPASQWKGTLTSGALEIELRPLTQQADKPAE